MQVDEKGVEEEKAKEQKLKEKNNEKDIEQRKYQIMKI